MASGNLGTLYYSVRAETAQLLSSEKEVVDSTKKMSGEFGKADGQTRKLSTSMNALASVIKTVIAASVLRESAMLVQRYQAMSERVEMATRSHEEYELVQRRLQSTADGTYRSLEEAQELYIRSAESIRSMGYELSDTLDIQDSLSYAFVTNATSAERAQAAITQFTKAVNTGKVSADQWETILTAIPAVVDDIAAASGKSSAEVRALGAAGKLTAKDLTEGLRKSLDETRKAADNMATDLVDAGVRSKNAITVVMAALEQQTGAIQAVTDGIIMASEAMLAFGQDSENIESLIKLLTVAGASMAAVYAGRLVSSMVTSGATMYKNTIVAKSLAAAELQAAQAAVVHTSQKLIEAKAIADSAGWMGANSVAAIRLTAAENAATAATARLTAAQRVMASTFSLATMAANGLRTAMAFLGGPAGLIFLVGAAFLTMGSNAKSAADDTELLTENIKDLTSSQRRLLELNLAEEIRNQEKAIEAANKELEKNARIAKMVGNAGAEIITTEQLAAIDTANQKIAQYNAQLEKLAAFSAEASKEEEPGGLPEITETEAGQKALAAMREQIELARKLGIEKAKLAAVQRLGADATDGERKAAEELATELWNIEEAQRAVEAAEAEAEKQREQAKSGIQDNADAISDLEEQIRQASMSALELAVRQAELSLNEYATPEQIARVKELAAELKSAQDIQAKKRSFGDDVAGQIRGDVTPLSGGAFDNQYARYAAEEKAEQERYASQLERLKEAKALELEVVGSYQDLEAQMAQEHASRLAQIEMAKNQMLLSSGENMFSALADAAKGYLGESSNTYKGLFAVSKAFAIANASLNLSSAISQAMADPSALTPAQKFANMAAVATAGAEVVSAIGSASFSGRQYGGPVAADQMYRVNETGGPEVFNAANGRQYMLPNSRGEVVSNKNASGGGGVIIHAPVTVNAQPGMTQEETRAQGDAVATAMKGTIISVLEKESRPGGLLWNKYGAGR